MLRSYICISGWETTSKFNGAALSKNLCYSSVVSSVCVPKPADRKNAKSEYESFITWKAKDSSYSSGGGDLRGWLRSWSFRDCTPTYRDPSLSWSAVSGSGALSWRDTVWDAVVGCANWLTCRSLRSLWLPPWEPYPQSRSLWTISSRFAVVRVVSASPSRLTHAFFRQNNRVAQSFNMMKDVMQEQEVLAARRNQSMPKVVCRFQPYSAWDRRDRYFDHHPRVEAMKIREKQTKSSHRNLFS